MTEGKHSTDNRDRRIRSFVRRQGRITAGQQKALDELWPRFGLDAGTPVDLPAVFGREAPVTLEIGFGNGASLTEMAAGAPETDFIGIEVHRPGVGQLLKRVHERNLDNVRVYCHDAVEILNQCLADQSLDRVLLFFPDPWHKKKHNKRRIIQAQFIQLVARKLKNGGYFHMATDWQPYAEHMLAVMDASPLYRNTAGEQHYSQRPEYRPVTRFEQRGQRLGHAVRDLVYQRK